MAPYSRTPLMNMYVKPAIIGLCSRAAIFDAGTSFRIQPSMRRSMTPSIPRHSMSVSTWLVSIQLYM